MSDRGGASGALGTCLLNETARMFAWWQRVRDGTLKRTSFQVYMRTLMPRVERILDMGQHDANKKTARMCANLLRNKESLWTFVRVLGVEPTNNIAERAVRHGVMYSKLTYGTQSEHGSRFVERMLTVHATLRQQKRDIVEFVQRACWARHLRTIPPSILPTQSKVSSLHIAA